MKLKREKTTGFREKNEQKKITGCCVVGAGDITARMRNEGGEVIPPPVRQGSRTQGKRAARSTRAPQVLPARPGPGPEITRPDRGNDRSPAA